jgi:3-dehydroquinate synthetase
VTQFRLGRGEIRRFAEIGRFPAGRAILVSSEEVLRFHGSAIREALAFREGFELAIDDREVSKNLDTLGRLLDQALSRGVRRDDFVVAFGGGVVTDVAGFAAAILLRGIAWFAVPTTLLGMADAAIGGKTAVDHACGKNLIGSFHLPAGVVIDPDFLATLPARQFRSGLAEVYKALLVGDAPMAESMSGKLHAIAEAPDVDDFLRAAVAVKRRIVEQDPRDDGSRRHLNFGHTLGHALEAQGRFRELTHGEAISIGMAAALDLSALRAGLDSSRARVLSDELVEFAGKEALSRVNPEAPELWEALSRDKKFTASGPMAVLLKEPGRPCLREVPAAQWKEALLRVLTRAAL